MNTSKLQAKDFITIGIFTAIWFVVEFACGMLGYIHPYIVASYVILLPLVGAVPMMLFYTKVDKFGMISIMSVLIAIIMFVTGMGYLGAPLIIIAGLVSDLVAKSGGYKSFKKTVLSYGVFCMLSDAEIKAYKLRPLSVNEHFFDAPSKAEQPAGDKITLKDFYFSYHHKPYLIWKKRFREEDGDALELSIPKLSIPTGKVIAVTGRNGMGKSTFLRCVCGLENSCKGVIASNGKEYSGKKRMDFTYMVMQDVNHQLFTDSVEAEVLLSMKDKDEERCLGILDSLGLEKYKNTHPMALSGGQKQRVAIASAIAAGARLLLLDEPTSGLDYAHMKKVGELLRNLADSGSTVLVATHDPEFIEQCCDEEVCITHGRVQ